jgi:hypothetical protein
MKAATEDMGGMGKSPHLAATEHSKGPLWNGYQVMKDEH